MANLINATVYQIDGNPQKVATSVAFDTSKIRLQQTTLSTISQVVSFIEVEGEKLNSPVVKYFVSESVTALVAAANTGGTTLLQATVVAINENPFKVAIQMAFPANKVTVWSFINGTIQSFLQFNEDKFYATQSKATLVTAANAGGGGGITGATNGLTLYGSNVGLGDILTVNTTIDGDGHNLSFLNLPLFSLYSQSINLNTPASAMSFVMDDANGVIRTSFGGNEIGLKLDFQYNNYILGNIEIGNNGFLVSPNSCIIGDAFGNTNTTLLSVNDNNSIINTSYQGSNIGLKLDFSISRYYLGDFDGNNNSTSIAVFDDNQNIYFYSGIGAYNFANIPVFPNNAAAILGGLGIGDIYRTGDNLKIVN